MRRTVKGIIYEDRVGPSNSKILIESELKRLYPGKKTLVIKNKDGWYLGLVRVEGAQKVGLLDEMRKNKSGMMVAAAQFHDSILPKTIPAAVYAITGLGFWGPPESLARAAFKKIFSGTTKFKLKVAFVGGTADSGTIAVAYTGTLDNKTKRYIKDWAE